MGRVAKVKDVVNTKVIQGLTFLQTHVNETSAFLPKIAGSKMPIQQNMDELQQENTSDNS